MERAEINTPRNQRVDEIGRLPFEVASSMMKLWAEPPTHCMDVAAELVKSPSVQTKTMHYTADGIRMVLTFDGDSHHEYEVVIKPVKK